MTDRNSHIALMIIAVLAALLVAWGPLGLGEPTGTVQAVWQKAEVGGHGSNRSAMGMVDPWSLAVSANDPISSMNSGHRLNLAEGPDLAIPDQVPASAGGSVTVPVVFTANGHSIAVVLF